MIVVTQNFDSLPPYLFAIFAVTMFATYVSQSSEWLGYAGIQAGITFLICYVGLAPTSDVYRPLWRFWGIVLGVLTTGFVFLFLWPEYASDKLIERLNRLTRTTLAFAREVAQGSTTEEGIANVEPRISAELLDVLNMADQARLEGRRGLHISAAGIETAITVVRIAYRFETIARGRSAELEALLPGSVRQKLNTVKEKFCTVFDHRVRRFELAHEFEPVSASGMASTVDLKPLIDEVVAVAGLENQCWSTDVRGMLVTQLESYHRLAILIGDLDAEISKLSGF
jgi:uncharacterized membrane protein YccC